MDKGKLANLAGETELGLFRANKQLKELGRLSKEIGVLLHNLSLLEQAAGRSTVLQNSLREEIKKRQIVAQGNELFKRLEGLRKDFAGLSDMQDRARLFVESYRTGGLYAFEDAAAAIRFARQLLELFSVQSVLFKPRFIGPIDLGEISTKLNLKRAGNGLVLQPKDIRPFARAMSDKRFASNISLEADGLKLVWQDRKTIAVLASSEKLGRLDRLCDALQGKCLEK